MLLNSSLIKAKLRGRKSLLVGEKTRIMWSSRIVNMGTTNECISTGRNCIVRGELLTFAHGGKIVLGDNCYIGEGARLWSGASIRLGDHIMISHGVSIMDNLTHPLDHLKRRLHYESLLTTGHPEHIDLDDKPIHIDDDAWIAAHSVILRGVHIGARAIVGAGSIVVKDVPADSVVAGNPARLVRAG